MEKQLRIFIDGGKSYIDIANFEYNAQRMGAAPTITATINSFSTLCITINDYCQFIDGEGKVVGEKYFVKSAPSESKTSSDARYKYSVTFVSENEILDNVYFIDASLSNVVENQVVSKGVDFQFSGTLVRYVEKLNAALSLSMIEGYSIVIDDHILSQDISKVDKFFSFSKATYTFALQEMYNQYDVPYYFVGKTIHVGYYNEDIDTTVVRYGSSDALIQVNKTSKNNKIITRCSGIGSSDNLPSYYPNDSQTGHHEIASCTGNITLNSVKSIDYEKLSKVTKLRDGATLTFKDKSSIADSIEEISISYKKFGEGYYAAPVVEIGNQCSMTVLLSKDWSSGGVKYQNYSTIIEYSFYAEQGIDAHLVINAGFGEFIPNATANYAQKVKSVGVSHARLQCGSSYIYNGDDYKFTGSVVSVKPKYTGKHKLTLTYSFSLESPLWSQETKEDSSRTFTSCDCTVLVNYTTDVQTDNYILVDDSDKPLSYEDCGVSFKDGFKPSNNSTIVVSETLNWMQPQKTLMPSIYRGTLGVERFYNAINGGYTIDDYVVEIDENTFSNQFNEGRFFEHIEIFEDIKPTIKGSKNADGLRMDMFSEFAYDKDDSDEIGDDDELKHKYFYAKLRKLDFNLFEHALEDGDMTFSFTSGNCAPCAFTIQVDGNTKKNTLQVGEDGNIVRDEYGRAVFDVNNTQDAQNDTINNEVWIALLKENDTYGEWRPNNVYKPNEASSEDNGDTFVITNISLPNSYIKNAEKELETRIIEHMAQNNISGYEFDVKFSRIFLENNKEGFTKRLNENSRIILDFNGVEYQLYVKSYSYKVTSQDVLPDISITISDALQLSKSGISNLVSSVKNEVLAAVQSIDIAPTLARMALRKDQDDSTEHNLSVRDLNVKGSTDIAADLNVKNNISSNGNLNVKGASKIQKGITVGNFSSVLGSISGAQISGDGDASFKSIKANSLEIMTLLYNQIRTSSEYTAFDDTATITEILAVDNDTRILSFDESTLAMKDENGIGIQPFSKFDIIYGKVNGINNYEYSKSGESWMRVTEIPTLENGLLPNQVKVQVYPSSEVPLSDNLEPTINMVVVHRGNTGNVERQSTFFISSKDGNIVQLLGVDKPKLLDISQEQSNGKRYSNYGVVIGKLPSDLREYIKHSSGVEVAPEQPYVYARGIAVQDFIQIDYAGRAIKTATYRGAWDSKEEYRETATTYDTVTHDGSLWACSSELSVGEEPSKESSWVLLISKGEDGDMPTIYIIASSMTSIHQDSNGNLSTNVLDIWVNAVGAPFNYEIKDQATLDAHNLSVWYNIDEEEDVRTRLTIGGSDSIEVEEGGAIVVAEEDDDDGGAYITLESESIDISSVQSKINIYLVRDADEDGFGEDENRMYIPVVRDGQRGRMLYPAGVYDNTKVYKIENNSAPFVKEGGTYYVLVYEGGEVTNIDPAEDYANNGGHWKPYTYMNYLFAEFLMANWAKFGSDKGGVFYDKYLFSQTGVNKYGTEVAFSKDMFDEDGNLTDKFTPNLLLNFDEGEAMLGKLTEVYHRYPANTGLIRMGDYHNIIVTPEAGRYGSSLEVQGFSSPLIILPQMHTTKWPTNGAHISIFADVGDYYKYPLEGLNDAPVGGVYKQMSAFALISADDILDGVGLRTRGIYSGNWIVANGYRSKFMLLSPGCMIKLRLSYNENTSTSGDETYNWVVEGGNEVQVTKSQIFARELHWSSLSEVTSKVPYQGYEWDRINNRGATLEFNWQSGDDENHPYSPVILTVGHVGENLGVTTINKDGVYLGHTKPNILLSTTQNDEGWYGGCYYRLLDAVNDEGYPDTDLE